MEKIKLPHQILPKKKTSDEPSCEELALLLDADLTEEEIQEWAQADGNNAGHQLYTDEEIISQVMREGDTGSEEDDDDDDEVSQKCISHSEAADMLEQCLG